MTDGKRVLGKLVGISFMIVLMVVGCGQGTQYASNVGEAITSNTETETSGTTALADTQDAAASDNKENFHTGGFWDYPDETQK